MSRAELELLALLAPMFLMFAWLVAEWLVSAPC